MLGELGGGCVGVVKGVVSVVLSSCYQRDDLYAFCPCNRNLAISLYERFLKPAMKARARCDHESPIWSDAFDIARKLGRNLIGVEPYTSEEVVGLVSSRQKKVYQRAYDAMGVFKKWWGVVEGFVKYEKYSYYDKQDRIPRPIQPRSMSYRAYLAMYMKKIETEMKQWILPGCTVPFMAKGKKNESLALQFKQMWDSFANPVAVSLDLSKCDGTIHERLKKLENCVYKFMSKDSIFRNCLKLQEGPLTKILFPLVVNGVKKRFQRRYAYTPSGRCSGDPQTGCGNTLIMAIVCRVVFKGLKIEVFANGDDTIVIMEKNDWVQNQCRMDVFGKFGLDVRVESLHEELEEVEWCQCHLTNTSVGWRWLRSPERILNTVFANPEYTLKNWRSFMKGIAIAELASNPGVPIISPLLKAIIDMNVRAKFIKTSRVDAYERWKLEGGATNINVDVEVSPRMRILFAERFRITAEQQIVIENRFLEDFKSFSPVKISSGDWIKNLHPHGLGASLFSL